MQKPSNLQSEEALMKTQPLSILHTIAEHYFHDALDFAYRFDALWENDLKRNGRIKSFVDLLMATECVLKAHVALGRINDDPKEVYKAILSSSHNLVNLANDASYLEDRYQYDQLASRLEGFSVIIRYSVEAHETFFPSLLKQSEADLDFSNTIGNNKWVLETRELLNPLLECLAEELGGFVTDDICKLLEHEIQMKAFLGAFRKRKPTPTGGKLTKAQR